MDKIEKTIIGKYVIVSLTTSMYDDPVLYIVNISKITVTLTAR